MRKRVLFALAALLCCWAVDATASTLTEDEALQIVKNSRIVEGLSNTDVNFYIAEVDTIINNYRCPVDVNTITEAWVTDNTPKWLVFVDEEPFKLWNHKCSYYYMGKDGVTSTVMFDGCLPPKNINMHAIEHNNSYNYTNYINNLPQLQNISNCFSSSSIAEANNTQVILYASSESHNTTLRYYGDIVVLYNCFRQYNIPKDNIHIVFEVNGSTDLGIFQLLSKDLDNDGVPEIDGNISLNDIIGELSSNSHPEHLIVFSATAGHALTTGNNVPVNYNSETAFGEDVINQINPRFLTYLSCRHGAALELNEIRHENLVFFGSCGIGETPSNNSIDLLVSGWAGAMTGYNYITNEPISNPQYSEFISMNQAATIINEVYYDQINSDESEREIIFYSNPNDLCDSIGITHLPKYSDLFIRDNDEDNGIEPNMTISNGITWNSPDIWIRNQDDGETNQFDDCLSIRNGNTTKYIYVRIHNKGGRPYTAGNKNVKISWGGIDLMQYPIEYCEAYEATTIPLDMDIEADSSVIVKCPIYLSEDLVSQLQANGGIASIGVTALVSDRQWYWGESPDPVGNVTDYNDLAFKKCLFLNPVKAMSVFDGTIVSQMYSEATIPFNINCEAASIEIIPDVCNTTNSLPNNLTLSLSLSSELYNQWVQNGSQSSGFSAVSNNKFRLSNTICTISEVFGTGTLFLKSKVLSAMTPANDFVALYHIIAKDENGNIIDGASVNIKIEGYNTHIIPGPGDGGIVVPGIGFGSNNNGQIQLSAKNVTKPSEYNWYDMDDNNIGKDETITILPEECENVYYLSVKDIESGNVGFAAIDLEELNLIKSLNVIGNSILVKMMKNAQCNTVIRISSLFDGKTYDFPVKEGDKELSIQNLPSGNNVISIIINGNIINSKQIII